MRHVLLFWFFVIIGLAAQAQPMSVGATDELVYYDAKEQMYLPLRAIDNDFEGPVHLIYHHKSTIHLLAYQVSPGTLVLLDNIIYKHYRDHSHDTLTLSGADENRLITFYHSDLANPVISLHYLSTNEMGNQRLLPAGAMNDGPILKDAMSGYKSRYIIILATLLVIIILMKNRYAENFRATWHLMGRKTEKMMVVTGFDESKIPLLLFNSISFGFFLANLTIAIGTENDKDLIALTALFTFYSLLLFLSKYMFLLLAQGVYHAKRLANFHFFDFLSVSFIFGVLLQVLSLFLFSPFSRGYDIDTERMITFLFFGFMIVLSGMLWYNIGHLTTFPIVHLFSYICTTEWIPFLFASGWFANEYLNVQ